MAISYIYTYVCITKIGKFFIIIVIAINKIIYENEIYKPALINIYTHSNLYEKFSIKYLITINVNILKQEK